ncbi:hypothetical protein [Rhizobium sullae]|uniref:hypothetical protein n=1 Tax=Rhizobium sullae TaxID=50338 RepID=UPI00104B2181|nr:hypothetical protein [Rhizobium sullae]
MQARSYREAIVSGSGIFTLGMSGAQLAKKMGVTRAHRAGARVKAHRARGMVGSLGLLRQLQL